VSVRALLLALVLLGTPMAARADAVGVWDPTLAEICGGSAHNPRCSPPRVGLCCCGTFGLASIGVVLFFTMGRRQKS
jgi:hypothetical protein